jgi:chitin synthase
VIHTELGAAVSKAGEKGDIVEVEVPSEQLDIDATYDDALANVRERRAIPEKAISESTLKEDYYREIRTRLVLIWIVSNATMSMALTEVYSTGLSGTNGYLKCIPYKDVINGSYFMGYCGIIGVQVYWIDDVFVGEYDPTNCSI